MYSLTNTDFIGARLLGIECVVATVDAGLACGVFLI
jgi:hypothetical protein